MLVLWSASGPIDLSRSGLPADLQSALLDWAERYEIAPPEHEAAIDDEGRNLAARVARVLNCVVIYEAEEIQPA